MCKDELHEVYLKMQAKQIIDEAEEEGGLVNNMPKAKLIQMLLVMTKFSEKFLKLQDEDNLKMLAQTFLNLDKQKMKKDLGISNLMKPQAND
jgi:hypothetical protein